MRIESIICPEYIDEKLQAKHGVTCYEAEQALLNRPRIRFAEKGILKVMMYMRHLDEHLRVGICQYSSSTNLM